MRHALAHTRRVTSLHAALLLAMGIALLGAAPHVWFSARAGEWTHFKAAFDEDTYARLALEGEARTDRAVATAAFRALHAAAGERTDPALIAADVLFPVLASLSAFLLASVLVSSPAGRVLTTLLLLFGQELFSLGCAAVTWPLPSWLALPGLREALGEGASRHVPDYYTSYLSLFRTPEPQVSLCLFFVHLALLVSFVERERGRGQLWLAALLAGSHALLMRGYGLLFPAVLVAEGSLAVLLAFVSPRRAALLVAAATVGVASLLFGDASGALQRYAYAASDFIVSPAVLYSVACVAFALSTLRRTPEGSALRGRLALACGAVPLLLMNQQVLTGWMVSVRDFERYANYPMLVMSAGLVFSTRSSKNPDRIGRAVWAAAAVVSTLVIVAQVQATRYFRDINGRSVAIARTIHEAQDRDSAITRVLVADVELVPLVATRLRPGAPVEFVLDYTDISRRPFPNAGGSDEARLAAEHHRRRAFEFFARSGLSEADVEGRLRKAASEIGRGSAFLLHFFFHQADVWYPFTDGRRVRRSFVETEIPVIVNAYARFVAEQPAALSEPVLYIISARLEPPASPQWNYRRVAQVAGPFAGDTTYVAYEQRLVTPPVSGSRRAGNREQRRTER